MEIFASLGVDGRILIAQIVNFFILLWVLNRFVYRPLLTFLEKRTATIEQGLNDAKQAKEQLDAARSQEEAILKQAQQEAQTLIAQAEAVAKQQRDLAVTETKTKIDQMLAQGEKKLSEERTKMLAEVKGELAQLVVLATEKVLQTKIDSTEGERMALLALREMEK
jgi:F-type H+-transporting ATPase subunit b